MQKCFVCLICTHFALWAMVRAEYGIKRSTGVSYLWMEFPSVTEVIFPRHLTLNLSITNFVGPLMYSIDANGNQLIVTMSGTAMNLLVESMGGQQQKISLRRLCGCKVCLYVPLLLEFGMDNSTFWTRCNNGVKSTVPFNSSSRSFKKGYPTLKPKQKDASSNANSADLYFINSLGGFDEKMQGCIFTIEYNGQPIGNNLTIVGQDIVKRCHRTCSNDTCKGGVCYDTYGSKPICDCSTVFGNGRYCSDDSQLVNKQFHHTFAKYVGIKLSWRSNKNIFWRIGNKQSTLNLTIDHSRQLVLTRQDSQRKSIHKNILLTEYIPNESYVLILRSTEKNSFKKINNVTVIYANYDVLKDENDSYDNMILSSCDGVMDMATLSDKYDIQWNRWNIENPFSSSYMPACDFPVKRDSHVEGTDKPNNGLLWLLVLLLVAVVALMIVALMWIKRRSIRRFMLFCGRLCIRVIRKIKRKNDEGHGKNLFSAAADGRLDVVKYWIHKGANVNAVDDRRRTALHCAAESGQLDVEKYLIDKGADVNAVGDWKMTPLHYAAERGHLEVVKYLIEHGADVDAVGDWKMTSLHYAAQNRHLEVVKYLIEKGADVNVVDKSLETPVHLSARNGYLDVVKYLIGEGANVNSANLRGETALRLADAGRHSDVVKFINSLDAGSCSQKA